MEKSLVKDYKILGMSIPIFALVSVIVLIGAYLDVLPKGLIGAFALMLVLGAILGEIGNNLPIVKTYLGGGPIVIIFGSAALIMFNVLPEASVVNMDTFMKGGGFLDFYIAALITGSILGMDRKLLINAAIRYLPAIIGGVLLALTLVGIGGTLLGFGGKEAILYIGVPIMGGGMGAGAVPLSKIFGEALMKDPADILSIMIPAVALGNALAIIVAGLLDKLGKGKKALTGEGELLVKKTEEKVVATEEKSEPSYAKMGMGLLLSVTFFIVGTIIAKYVPSIHSYAWMIITVAVVKATGIMPKKYEEGAYQWFQFVMSNLTGVLLIGIGVSYTNLAQVISAFSLQYILLVGLTILGAVVGSGLVGKWVGFYPIESSITAGLCMANMGGTGDVAVLSASKRMKLMPFAQISSRIGGAFMLILATALLGIFL